MLLIQAMMLMSSVKVLALGRLARQQDTRFRGFLSYRLVWEAKSDVSDASLTFEGEQRGKRRRVETRKCAFGVHDVLLLNHANLKYRLADLCGYL